MIKCLSNLSFLTQRQIDLLHSIGIRSMQDLAEANPISLVCQCRQFIQSSASCQGSRESSTIEWVQEARLLMRSDHQETRSSMLSK